MIRILVFSGHSELGVILRAALRDEFAVRFESNARTVQKLVSAGDVDVVIMDIDSRYPVTGQLAAFAWIAEAGVPVVVTADDDRRPTAIELLHKGAYDYFRKPPALPDLKIVVQRAYKRSQLRKELDQARAARSAPVSIIGESRATRLVFDLIRRVADRDVPVLIHGESGTGKELVARGIHTASARASKPFVAVSCSALPESLIEAELFGSEKGAYTGADSARIGRLEQAADGTLFLDEIGELPLAMQVKLLRVLQQREFARLGSNRLIPLRARLVFATHRSLPEMVKHHEFREDLFFRINVVKIEVAPLRNRPEDIPLLARHFVAKYSAEYDRRIVRIEPDALDAMCRYHWPGNVRELENAIQCAIVLTEGDTIRRCDLPEQVTEAPVEVPLELDETPGDYETKMHEYRVTLVRRALDQCRGNRTLAARTLNISRTYLHRVLEEAGSVPATNILLSLALVGHFVVMT